VVEAVLAALAESVNETRTAKNARTGIERGLRQGRQRFGHAGEWEEENAPTIPARSAEAMRSVVKRSHPRLGGRQPIEATTGEEPDPLDRERGRVRVLVV
jgi:hypothetical protein